MALDMTKLKEAEAELDKKSGSKNWVHLSKITDPIDIRVMDPLPSMNGIYYIEVPVWWINGTRIISPKLYGPGEYDPIHACIEDAKAAKDPAVLKLLSAKDETKKGAAKVQFKPEYWIAALKFNWTLDPKTQQIKGIWMADGVTPDVALIEQFIEDGKWKIVSMGIQALKAINKIATSRGGYKMVNQADGFNITLSKTGVDRNTVYSALPADALPMPPSYYTDEKMIDPFEVAESLMFTNEYMDMVIGKYLYGEECPEKPGEEHYANPELREKLKSRISDESEAEEIKPSSRPRPGRGAAPAPAPATEAAPPARQAAPEPTPEAASGQTEQEMKLAEARRILAEAEAGGKSADAAPAATRTRTGRGTPAAAPAAPGRGGARPQRNLSADLNNVD